MIDAKFTGLKKLNADLHRFEAKVSGKIASAAVKDGRRATLAEARSNAKAIGGNIGRLIAKSIKLKKTPKKKLKLRGAVAWQVDLYEGPSEFVYYPKGSSSSLDTGVTSGKRTYIPYAIEYGHAGPGDAGGRKVAAPVAFMRRAHEATRGKSLRVARDSLERRILAEWKK